MKYQNPELLFFLIALAIPIIIHLFNLRKHKKIYFSSIRFLKEIKEKNRRKANLKNILVLISRILAIFFLIIAFAYPYIPSKKNTIYVDKMKGFLNNFLRFFNAILQKINAVLTQTLSRLFTKSHTRKLVNRQ